MEDIEVNFRVTLKRTFQLTLSRLKAYGLKWKKWSLRNLHTSRQWVIPEKHRDPGLIKFEFDGSYSISKELYKIILELDGQQFSDAPSRRGPNEGFMRCIANWREILRDHATSLPEGDEAP